MASPTEAEVRTQIGNAVKLLDDTDAFLRTNSPNAAGDIDTLMESLETDWAPDVGLGVNAMRDALAATISRDRARAMLDPLILTYGKQQGFPDRDPVAILARLYDAFDAATDSVKERNFTFGSVSAGGSNAGDGTINRLNVDENGYEIEAQAAEAKTALCIEDEHSGASEHKEVFEFRGAATPRDLVGGYAGEVRVLPRVAALSADDSTRFVQNPTFNDLTGTTGTPTGVTGWTVVSSLANLEIVEGTGNTYRTARSEGGGTASANPRGLKIKAVDGLKQNLHVASAQFDPDVPIYVQVAVNKDIGVGVGGSFRLTFGAQTATLALASFGAGWNIVRIALGTGNWFKGFNQENPEVKVEWITTATSGYIVVDDLVVAPFTNFNGGWYAVVGGATPFLRDDVFTWTDSEVGAKVQEWLWRAYGVYLPPNATPTWSDP